MFFTPSNWWTLAPARSSGKTAPKSKNRGWKTRRIASRRCFIRPHRLLASCLVGVLSVGCATTQSDQGWQRTGDPVVDGKAAIEHGPKRDRVLWEYRAAAAAMRRGQFAEAKPLLDDALVTLGGIYGPDKEAKRARGYFSPDRKSTRLNSSHGYISYAVFCLK